jgi:hypothetical protein
MARREFYSNPGPFSKRCFATGASRRWRLCCFLSRSPPAGREAASEKRLLNERALKEIEAAEAAYIQSIEKLSSRIQPALEGASSPLMMNYREKLALIDSAIADCRANIDRNRFNAYLRKELLSIYQEKERTLVDLIKENKNEQP